MKIPVHMMNNADISGNWPTAAVLTVVVANVKSDTDQCSVSVYIHQPRPLVIKRMVILPQDLVKSR